MSTKVFSLLTPHGGDVIYGDDLTANGATIEPGLIVILDAAGNTASLAAATGSKPFGFAYGNRDGVYAPTTKVFADGEAMSVVTGAGMALLSADFFSSGSLPTEQAGGMNLFAAANGKIAITGTNQIGRMVDTKTFYDGTGGTGTAVSVALVQFDFGASS